MLILFGQQLYLCGKLHVCRNAGGGDGAYAMSAISYIKASTLEHSQHATSYSPKSRGIQAQGVLPTLL